MNEGNKSDAAVAQLLRFKCILEVERNALFDALTGLLEHMRLADAGRGRQQTALVCGVAIDDRQLEAALRHAQLVLRDESAAAAARAGRQRVPCNSRARLLDYRRSHKNMTHLCLVILRVLRHRSG